jgi:primosomal protein N' (replication factor Y)
MRQALNYPPYATLIRIVCAATEPGDALAITTALHKDIAVPETTVLGPAPLFRLRAKSRSQLVIKTTRRHDAITVVGAAVDRHASAASRQGVSISVDVDPQ